MVASSPDPDSPPTEPSPVGRVFAQEWHKLVAILVKDLGDLDLAEEAAQEAFVEATRRWGEATMPDQPGAWLVTVARRRAIDGARRRQGFEDRLPALVERLDRSGDGGGRGLLESADDQLALIFGCCHQALNVDAQIALTLREVCGLTTGQIAAAFLVEEATLGKRLVRAKAKIRSAGIPFTVPGPDHLAERLQSVLHCIYLIFSEGYASTNGTDLVRGDLCEEARWLADLVAELVVNLDERPEAVTLIPETLGLQALIRFVEARRPARLGPNGGSVLLENQDRARWDRDLIDEADKVLRRALAMGRVGPFQIQAAIAGVHDAATTWEETDWTEIAGLYSVLRRLTPGPVVELNRAVAVSMVEGPEVGLTVLDDLFDRHPGALDRYRYFHAARADMLRRLGRGEEAAAAYRRAIALTPSRAETAFLNRRLGELTPDARF